MELADLKEIKETEVWILYQQARNYCYSINMFSETDLCYRMYNDDQWHGVKLKGVEPVQLNFIKPVLRYKTSTLHSNLYAINYSSQNFENREFRTNAEKICKLLNKKVDKIWERNNFDVKGREVTRDAGINGEGLIYSTWDEVESDIVTEVIKKNDIFYGNENDSDMQMQPYILIKQRRPVIDVIAMARSLGASEEKIKLIRGDNDNYEESGDSAKLEKDTMCTIVTKMWKEDGKVYYSSATKYCELKENIDSGLTLYPVAHFLWEAKEGTARGQGEVKYLIPNQLEVNKTIMRRILVAKNTAYPQKVADMSKIQNPDAVNTVGGVIKVKGSVGVDDVSKVFNTIQPAQMSTDVEKLQEELISITRELAGAGETATGQIDPTEASGKAILAVQQASQQPMTEQLISYKSFLEDLARIWLDMIIAYNPDGIVLEEELEDPTTGETVYNEVEVPQQSLNELKATVKVDITPKSAYDKYAQELSMENLLKGGYFSSDKLGELKVYVETLEDDSTMPKQKLLDAIEKEEKEQQKIAMMNAQAQIMKQNAMNFLNSDVNSQAAQLNEAQKSAMQTNESNEIVDDGGDL